MGSYLLIFQILVEPIFLSPYFCFVLLLLLFKLKKIFIFGYTGSSLLHTGFFLNCGEWGLLLLWSTDSRCTGFGSWGTEAQ